MKNKLTALAAVTFLVTAVQGQSGYRYARPIENVTAGWHTLLLNNDFLPRMNDDLNDIRVLKITGKDTSEVPYLLQSEIPDTVLDKKGKVILIRNARTYFPVKLTVSENKKRKETGIGITIPDHSWINEVQLYIHDTLAYQRYVRLEAPTRFRKKNTGRAAETVNYEGIVSDYIAAKKEARFAFTPRFNNNLKLTIMNEDNAPLQIDSVTVSGPKQRIMARFPEAGNYLVVYGKESAFAPRYDIVNFDIPANASLLVPGNETALPQPAPTVTKKEPLFKNKAWLYGLMGILIVIIGGFSVMMMRKKED